MTLSRTVAFVLRMTWRETRASWARLLFFFVCVAIGVAAIIVLRSVVQQIRTTLTREARSLIGSDLQVQTNHPWTPEMRATIPLLVVRTTLSENCRPPASSASGP